MNNEIVIISTTSAVTKKVKKVLEMRPLRYPVFEATMQRALEISQKQIELGTKVIFGICGILMIWVFLRVMSNPVLL